MFVYGILIAFKCELIMDFILIRYRFYIDFILLNTCQMENFSMDLTWVYASFKCWEVYIFWCLFFGYAGFDRDRRWLYMKLVFHTKNFHAHAQKPTTNTKTQQSHPPKQPKNKPQQPLCTCTKQYTVTLR